MCRHRWPKSLRLRTRKPDERNPALSLSWKAHLFRRSVVHPGPGVSSSECSWRVRPFLGETFPLPELGLRFATEICLQMSGEEVIPSSRVPQLPCNRMQAESGAPEELLSCELFGHLQQTLVIKPVEADDAVLHRARLDGYDGSLRNRSFHGEWRSKIGGGP